MPATKEKQEAAAKEAATKEPAPAASCFSSFEPIDAGALVVNGDGGRLGGMAPQPVGYLGGRHIGPSGSPRSAPRVS